MIKVSILGCCVLRDAIAFEDKMGGVVVERFVQFITPMTMFGGRPVLRGDILEPDTLAGADFVNRCMYLDFKKLLFEYLSEVKSDYILLDVSNLVIYFYAFENGICFTESRGFLNNEKRILDLMGMSKEGLARYRRGIFDLSVNEIRYTMKVYAKKILSMYEVSQIILVELYMAEKYIDAESGVPVQWWHNMLPTHSQNAILQIAYETFKQELGNVHTISFPKETYGDVNHKWGKYQLHYQGAYYKYLWKELMKIMEHEERKLK